jgi:hypothetical protein
MSITPAFIIAVRQTIARWHAWRETARTRRIVSGLPRHIRKDIGWPDTVLPDRRDTRWL